MKKTMWMMAALVSLCAAMAVGQEKDPDWVNKPGADVDGSVVRFVGLSLRATSERTARRQAEADGRRRWALFSAATVKTRLTEKENGETNAEAIFEDHTKSQGGYDEVAKASARLAKVVEYYTKTSKDSQGRDVYLVYALMEVDQEAYAKNLADIGKKLKTDLAKKPPKGWDNQSLKEVLDYIDEGLVDNDEPIDFSDFPE